MADSFDDIYDELAYSDDAVDITMASLMEGQRLMLEGNKVFEEDIDWAELIKGVGGGFIATSKSAGTYHVHHSAERAEIGFGNFPPGFTAEDIVKELSSYLDYTQIDPLSSLLLMIDRVPEAALEVWSAKKIKQQIKIDISKAGVFFGFEFDPKPFEECVTHFEKLLATCYKNKTLWEEVSQAIFDERIIKVHIEDLIKDIVNELTSESEGSPRKIMGIERMAETANMLVSSGYKMNALLVSLKDMMRKSFSHMVPQAYENNLFNVILSGAEEIEEHILELDSVASGDIETIDTMSQGDYLYALSNYRNILEKAYESANRIYSLYKGQITTYTVSVPNVWLGYLNQISGIKFALQELIKSVDRNSSIIDHNIKQQAERLSTPKSEAKVDDIRDLKSGFWDVEEHTLPSQSGVPMFEMKFYGISKKIIDRLKQLGMLDSTVETQIEMTENAIFTNAKNRAETAFYEYVDVHFSSWPGGV